MRRDDKGLGLSGLGVFNLAKLKESLELFSVVLLSEIINSLNSKDSAKSRNSSARSDFVTGQVIVSDEVLTWLINSKSLREFLSSQKKGKRVSAVIGMMDLSHLDCVVCQIVVDDERSVITLSVESENLSVVIQELLLRNDSSTSESFF